MRKTAKRFFAILLAVTMLVGLLPTLTLAGSAFDGEGKASESVYVYTDEDYAAVQNDVFAKIETVKADAAAQLGGIGRMTEQNYVDLVPQVISAVESSETYVPGTLQQNGNFLVWMTSTGLPCCYSPRMEAQLHNTEDDPTPADIAKAEERAAAILEAASTRGIGPTSMDIGLIQPFWESTSNYADSSFNNYSPSYKAMWQSLAEATGGNTIRYSMSNANIDNIASTMSQCGVVIFDSHGDTDYSGSNQDYTSRANTSYLCLTATSGFTSLDTAAQTGEFGTYYNAMVSNGYGYINGTAIANHMAGNAPNSLLYMGICLGMATDGMHKGLRQKGVEVVHGYSQSVTFVGEKIYMNSILGYVKDGMTYSEAITTTKNETCWWDPHPDYTSYTESQAAADDIAFPIVVSSEDVYPGHGNVDAIQNVYSTWSLFGDAFEVTAVSNNTGWGTVAVSGYTITASPAEGYFAQGYTVLNGTATVTQDGNVFRVRPETDCTVQINFAAKTPAVVTYVSSGTTVGTVNTFIGDDVILSADVTEIPGWTFLGWMTDHISMTTEKPAYMKPGTSYTVNAANVTIFAVYKHVEGSGGLCYQLVTETPRGAFDGRYVISSAKDSSMNVMTGVSGNVNVESGSAGFTAFGSTGIELEDNALRNVDDAYIFEVEEQGSSAYSFQNVDAGTYLAVYDSYFWVRENYESAYCNWTITPSADGAVLRCGASTSYPYLSWSGSRWMASSSSSIVQLWKEYDDGTTYYWTDPVVEAHDHVMTAYPAVAPTCGANGHTAYWQCSVCYKYFSDAAGENEITLSSTVIPATGNHTYGAWISNDNGTHDHVCTVCGAAETESCVYESVVTAPTPTEGGYTTYTCTVCGYTYVGNNTSPTGYDITIVFSVPLECEQPYDMICNNLTGVTLPVLEAPEGYTFLGWVEQPYDNVDARPAEIYSGHYTTNADVTLYALFKYVEADGSGELAYELVTAQPADWTGNYVITYNNTTALYAMKGMDADVSYEDTGNGSAVAYASTGMTLTEDVLTDVADAFVFHVAQESSGKYSIQSIDFDTYVGITDGTLTAIGDYESSTCDYTLTLESAGNVSAYMSTAGTWPYIAFSTGSNEFWCFRSTSGIYFWKEVIAGTPYWTTIIGEPDPGVDYTITFTTPNGVTAPAPMTVNNMTGAVLPTVTAPEGYTFLGWVTADYDNVDVKPEGILSGRYRPQSDITLKALFKYKDLDGSTVAYELVTEQLADWTGNYVITCNKDEETMIVMHGVGADMTYEHQDSYGMYELADSGLTLEDNFLYDAGENYVFAIEAQDEGYSIQNLGSENYVGRYVTTESKSAQLYSFSAYDPTFCRWTFEYGNSGDADVEGNVLIANVRDASLDGNYPYLGCGWYYHFLTGEEFSNNSPYFWVNGTGDPADSDVFFMFLWKETEAGTNYYTTIIEDVPVEEDLVDVYFVDQDDNATAYFYAFGSGVENAAFPGEAMTAVGTDENGDNYYKVTLDRSVYTNVIFSGGTNTTQTADLGLGTGEYIIYYVNNHTGYEGSDIWPAPPVVVEPTCTEEGSITYTGMFTGAEHVTTTEALGHDYAAVVTEPTCTEPGFTTYTCSRCGDTYTEALAALGHNWGAWTFNGDNTHTRVCANDPAHVETDACVDENKDCVCDICGSGLIFVLANSIKPGDQVIFVWPGDGENGPKASGDFDYYIQMPVAPIVVPDTRDGANDGYYGWFLNSEAAVITGETAVSPNAQYFEVGEGTAAGTYTFRVVKPSILSYYNLTEAYLVGDDDTAERRGCVLSGSTEPSERLNWTVTFGNGLAEVQYAWADSSGYGSTMFYDTIGSHAGIDEGFFDTTSTGSSNIAIYKLLTEEEEPVEPIETTDLHIYNSISVGTDMVITFTARKNDLTNYSNFWIEVVKHNPDGDVAYTYNPDVMTEGTSTWAVQFKNIYAKEMGIDVEARLYAEDAEGQIYMSPAKNANIRDYLGGRLTATNNKVEQRVLAADMLNYGAAAQMFTGFQTEHLVNEELSADQLAKLHEYETTELPLVEKTNYNTRPDGTTNILFTSVTLGNEVLLNLTIRLAEGTEGVQVLVKNHETGEVVTTLDTTFIGSTFSATFNGIGADAMRTEFDLVTVVNGVETGNIRTWSVEAYVGEIRTEGIALKVAMGNALLTYGDSAAAYFAAQ